MSSVEDSEPTYSSIKLLNTNEDDDALVELPDEADTVTDDEKGNLLCEKTQNVDNYRLCKAKAARDAVVGNIEASLVKKTLTAMEAPHLHTKSFFTKLDDVAKTDHLDVSTILAERIKNPVLATVRSRLRKEIPLQAKSPEFQQSKRLVR